MSTPAKLMLRSAVVLLFSCLLITWTSAASAQVPAQPGEELTPAVVYPPTDSASAGEQESIYPYRVNIQDSLRHEGLREVLTGIIHLKEGRVGGILQKLWGADPRWVWIVQEATLPGHVNAITDWTGNGVLTRVNYRNLRKSTKLSVARTLIHEMIHAYLVLHFRFDTTASNEYPRIAAAYQLAPGANLNSLHHKEMALHFVNDIAVALREYGRRLGLKADDSVYTDLAWGGLDFHNNDQLEESRKLQIQQRLNAEQFNALVYPIQPAGPEMSD